MGVAPLEWAKALKDYQQATCEHGSASGVDQAPFGPSKVWLCHECGAEFTDVAGDSGHRVTCVDGCHAWGQMPDGAVREICRCGGCTNLATGANFGTSLSLGPPLEAPPEKAIGMWTCRCGRTSMGQPGLPLRSTFPASAIAACPYCGDRAEVMAMPWDGASPPPAEGSDS